MKFILVIHIFLAITFPGYPGFYANDRYQPEDTIKIGLLIQDNNSDAAINGAELAISKANQKGGFNGKKFSLVVRSMEGPWGTGSKQAVNLIFGEKVWALTGCHDGRNAHLVEQAATKSTIPYISAWSSDPTLSQAFVPWFFNCVPTDRQQALSIINSIYDKHKFKRVIVIKGSSYDEKMTAENFLKALKSLEKPDPEIIDADDSQKDQGKIVSKISVLDADCLVLFCDPDLIRSIVNSPLLKKTHITFYSSLMAADENKLTGAAMRFFDDILFVASGDWNGPENQEFRKEYIKKFNNPPGMIASFSYDATSLLTEAIRRAGKNDRELIQKAIREISYKGVTGLISFDDKGNRSGSFNIMRLKEGLPYLPE